MYSVFSGATLNALLRSSVALFALAGASPALAAAGINAATGINAAAGTDAASAATIVADDAGDAGSSGPDVVVTARHREEKVQSVPVAISVLSAQAIQQSGDYSISQFQHEVPSLQVVNLNPRNTNVTIRGLGANSSLAVDGLEYGVGFYLDGVYYGRPGSTQFDLIDLSQVEILRGPQGTLFGKNTTAGALNLTSREPSFKPELTAEVSAGNYGTRQVRASASVPLIDDKVAFRLTVSDTHHDGYQTNIYDGSEVNNYDNFSIRGQLLIKPNDRLKIRLIGDYSSQQQHGMMTLLDGYFTNYSNGNPMPYTIFQRAAANGLTLPTYGAFARLGDSNSPFQVSMKSYGVSGEVDYDLGRATLTSITAYRWWDWWPANDGDGLPLPIVNASQQQNFQRQFSQELRIASNGRHFIDYVAGLYYFWQTVPGYGKTIYGSDYVNWYGYPAALNPIISNAEIDSRSVANTKSYAAYAQADTHLTRSLTLTTGLRFTHEDKSGLYQRWQNADSVAQLSIPSTSPLYPNLARFQLNNFGFVTPNVHDNALSGLVTLGYKITPAVLVYGTYSRGNQSGGLNITAGGAASPVVAPEKVDNFEAGIKSQFLNRTLTINADVFLTNVKNWQANVSFLNQDNVLTQYISSVPKVRSKGIEGDITYIPRKWLRLSASLAYTDAKYVNYPNAPTAPEAQVSGIQNLSGVMMPNVSKFAYTLTADLSQPISSNHEAYFHTSYLHRSSFNSSATNSIYSLIPGYGVLDARIGVRTSDGRYDLSIYAKNLTNENYYISRTSVATGLITAFVGDPRTYGITFRAKY